MSETYIPEELSQIADQVRQGQQPVASVRTLLSWFWNSKRRGRWITQIIRSALDELGIQTVPDFDATFIDDELVFLNREEAQKRLRALFPTEILKQFLSTEPEYGPSDPIDRIGRLQLANIRPIFVAPGDTVDRAITVMLRNDFSQLPVMEGENKVLGIFSWKSLGSRRAVGQNCVCVRDAIDKHVEVSPMTSLFEAIDLVEKNDCVLLRGNDGNINSIITPYDIGVTFETLSTPFLILRNIEDRIRDMISDKLTEDEILGALALRRPRRKSGIVYSLTFGDYVRLIENPECWSKLGLGVHLNTFREELDKIRELRNTVMHFDPEGVSEEDLRKLRTFVEFLQRLTEIRKTGQGRNALHV